MLLKIRLTVFFSLLLILGKSQGTLIPIGSDQELYIDRMCTLYGTPDFFHRSVKPFYRKEIIGLIQYWRDKKLLAPDDDEYLKYIADENNEWLWNKKDSGSNEKNVFRYHSSEKPFLKYFYHSPANALEANQKDLFLRVNPIINLQGGIDAQTKDKIIANQRGIDLRIGVDDKLYAQTQIIDNQISFPKFYRDKIDAHKSLPGAGLYKELIEHGIYKPKGYDFFIGNAQLGVRISPHVHMQIGHATNFIGDGIRSLLLSDYAQEYFFLKLNTHIWKLDYQNTFAELSATTFAQAGSGTDLLTKKYMASHTLQVHLFPKLTVGIFETVLFHRKDHFEFQYLNPVILYRSVEGAIGSPDNVMLGINGSMDIKNRIQLYGQVIIDEFIFKEVLHPSRGNWANKLGGQIGAKYFNAFGVNRLDLQAEFNTVRPYTYSHFDSIANYTHQLTPLAHPLGANFKELILKAKYQPSFKWTFNGYILLYKVGEDPTASVNYGSDINKSYLTRIADYGINTLQGKVKSIHHIGGTISYQPFHNYYLDLNAYYRVNGNDKTEVTKYIGCGIRVNFWRKDLTLL